MKRTQGERNVPAPDRSLAILSANVYCDRRVHDLLRHVVVPLGQEVERLGGPDAMLWFWRYSRCGQHIKLRMHTPDEEVWPALRGRLTEFAESFFATLPAAGQESAPRISTPRLPPIDAEDARDEDYPDRLILWTRFRPSPRTVGSEKYLADNRLLSLFYRCMGENSALVLAEVAAADGEPPLKVRQSQLLRTLAGSFFTLDLSPEEQRAYLGFHRDWLLRYLLSQSPPETTAEETVERLNQKLDAMESTVNALSSIVADQMSPDAEEGDAEEDGYTDLRSSLGGFFGHVRGFRGRPEYDLDPYTTDYAFLPLFKVLHGFANQIGVPILNELYTYQLFLRAVERAHSTAASSMDGAARDE